MIPNGGQALNVYIIGDCEIVISFRNGLPAYNSDALRVRGVIFQPNTSCVVRRREGLYPRASVAIILESIYTIYPSGPSLLCEQTHSWVNSRSTCLLVARPRCRGAEFVGVFSVAVHVDFGVDTVHPEFRVNRNVVVGEFAKEGVIDADDFLLFGSLQSQERNEVEHPAEKSGNAEGVGHCGGTVGKL